jgi:alkylated DNA repair dioxygenase AlkB
MKRNLEECHSSTCSLYESTSSEKKVSIESTIFNEKIIPISSLCHLRLFEITTVAHTFALDCANEILTNRTEYLIEKPPVFVYGQERRQQRDVGFFSDVVTAYVYSHTSFPSKPLSQNLRFLLEQVNIVCKSGFNGILVNVYDSGENYISAHSDDEAELDKEAGVVALSVGQERPLRIRDKVTKVKLCDAALQSGQFVQMCGAKFQKLVTHEIPKQKTVKGWRVSFTFRKHVLAEQY